MRNSQNKLFQFLSIILFTSGIGWLEYSGNRANCTSVILPYVIVFLVYLWILGSRPNALQIKQYLFFGFMVRLILLFSFPILSDDIYRFCWDGFLLNQGINPFMYTPSEIMQMKEFSDIHLGLSKIYPFLNSSEYHSVYPAFSQFIFAIANRISGFDIAIFNVVLKLIFLLADLIIVKSALKLLKHFRLPKKNILLYFLNPLVILELNGNLHFEIWMIAFFAMSVSQLTDARPLASALSLALSVLSKMVSAIVVPWYLIHQRKTQIIKFILAFCLIMAIQTLMIPWTNAGTSGFLLYFQKFEFNSSIYILLREYFHSKEWWITEQYTALILKGLFALIAVCIWLYDIFHKSQTKFHFKSIWMLWFAYLCTSSTIHPWYLTPLLFLGIFTFPLSSVVWSFLIFGSYIFYDDRVKEFFPYYVTIEYFILTLVFLYELNIQQRTNSISLKKMQTPKIIIPESAR
ncbi:MAG: hypothetical protein IPH93_12395 [Saprospiraceae bacterium]|nr:hypothetical protein [Saprospiraceae bacterium]MBK7812744.1 hypothetical protein [Saprospiraceae bacterium]MBK9630935.1 hypothetical protein [Saprospiraceae bacterium]